MLSRLGALLLARSGLPAGQGGAAAACLGALPHAITNPWLQRLGGAPNSSGAPRTGLHTSSSASHGHSSDDEGPKET